MCTGSAIEPVRSCTRVDKMKKHNLACSFYSQNMNIKGKLILVSIRALNSSPAKEYVKGDLVFGDNQLFLIGLNLIRKADRIYW